MAVPDNLRGDITDIINRSHEAIEKLDRATRQLFTALQAFMTEFPGGQAYNQKIRLSDEACGQPGW